MDKIFKKIAFLIVFIFLVNFLAMKFHWYFALTWFDMPMHFLGGLFIGLLALTVYFRYFKAGLLSQKTGFGPLILIAVISTLSVAILWELFEFSLDTFITMKDQNIHDSLSDLAFGLAGSFGAVAYFRYNMAIWLRPLKTD